MSADQLLHSPQSLSGFLNNFGCFQKSTAEFSEFYIANAIIEILYANGSHLGNGLLLTQDGYFLTCDHCLTDFPGTLKARLSDGRTISHIRVCARDLDHDMALCKISLAGHGYNCFRFCCPDKRESGQRAIYLGRCDGRLVRKEGNFTGLVFDLVCQTVVTEYFVDARGLISRRSQPGIVRYYGHLQMNIEAQAGDSGGLIIRPDGSLVGLLSTASLSKDKNISAAGIKNALPLIWEYVSAYAQKYS